LNDPEFCKSALNTIWQLISKLSQGNNGTKDPALKQIETQFLHNKDLLIKKVIPTAETMSDPS